MCIHVPQLCSQLPDGKTPSRMAYGLTMVHDVHPLSQKAEVLQTGGSDPQFTEQGAQGLRLS